MDIPSHLLPTKMERADYAIGHNHLVCAPGVTPEHIVDPDFWAHLAGPGARPRLKVMDKIDVVALDGSFDATLRCVALDPRGLWAQMRVLRMWKPTADEKPVVQWPDKDGYTIEFDTHQRWRIVRGQNLVAKDFPDERSAVAALKNLKSAKKAA